MIGATDNTIGGSVSGDSNLISGDTYFGIYINGSDTSDNIVAGNEIGTDISGTLAVANAVGVGILNAPDNMIGGSISGDGNLISGNTYGVYLFGAGTTGTIIAGNRIGTDITGTRACPSLSGIYDKTAADNTIGGTTAGAGNTIAFNADDAVDVITGTGDAILENLIFGNGSGIVLTSGGNDDQAAPVVTSVGMRIKERGSVAAAGIIWLNPRTGLDSISLVDLFEPDPSPASLAIWTQWCSGPTSEL